MAAWLDSWDVWLSCVSTPLSACFGVPLSGFDYGTVPASGPEVKLPDLSRAAPSRLMAHRPALPRLHPGQGAAPRGSRTRAFSVLPGTLLGAWAAFGPGFIQPTAERLVGTVRSGTGASTARCFLAAGVPVSGASRNATPARRRYNSGERSESGTVSPVGAAPAPPPVP